MPDDLPKVGLFLPNFGPFFQPSTLAQLALEAEDAGWDGFFLWDHIAFGEVPEGHDFAAVPDNPVVDPWIALSAVAVATNRIRIGALLTPIARRRPWKLARETVSLDHLSDGRLIFGTGLGYSAPVEFAAFGEVADDRERAAILDEGLEVLDRLWSGEPVEFSGEHFQVHSAPFHPQPVQRPRIPIWVGGWWPHRRPFERAARWDGAFPERDGGSTPSPADVAAIRRFISERRQSDGPFDIVIDGTTEADTARATIDAYAGTGVTWWLEKVDPSRRFSVDEIRARIAEGPFAA